MSIIAKIACSVKSTYCDSLRVRLEVHRTKLTECLDFRAKVNDFVGYAHAYAHMCDPQVALEALDKGDVVVAKKTVSSLDWYYSR